MAENTAIAWADDTFNPWIGCTKVSPGCDHCYAEALMDKRYHKVTWGPGNPRMRTSPANWAKPLAWNRAAAAAEKPRRVFCASLADVFDNEVPVAWRMELFDLIRRTPYLTWMLLTKRIGNVEDMLPGGWYAGGEAPNGPYPNVWLGITVVNQEEADRDIPKLLAVPARVRFLSCEPMLGPISIPGFNASTSWCPICRAIVKDSIGSPHELDHPEISFADKFDPAKHCIEVPTLLNWVICGGESGHHARPFGIEWARSLRDQCGAAGVPFFMKQVGAKPYVLHPGTGHKYDLDDPVQVEAAAFELQRIFDNSRFYEMTDRAGADPAEWPEDLRVQEFPA